MMHGQKNIKLPMKFNSVARSKHTPSLL